MIQRVTCCHGIRRDYYFSCLAEDSCHSTSISRLVCYFFFCLSFVFDRFSSVLLILSAYFLYPFPGVRCHCITVDGEFVFMISFNFFLFFFGGGGGVGALLNGGVLEVFRILRGTVHSF